MVKKKVDSRVRGLIEHNVRKNHRTLLLLVGDHGKDQVENIHKVLSQTRVRARPNVLWCYKKELGFSTHRKKRMKEIKRNQARGLHDPDRDDPFDLFISSTDIRWTYYKETDRILGQTFGMCVLQDFEALTPNLLARTIETVEGGGIVIILLKTVKSLKQLYTLSMDVHNRYRTEAHHEVMPRFNERFILSLGGCDECLVLDDELNVLPISSKADHIPSYEGSFEGREDGDADASGHAVDPELAELKASLVDTPHVGNLVGLTKTADQAKAVLSFLDAISERSLRYTVSLTAGRGRGKSAAIGLCLAGAISYGYSNVFVTAPSPENLKTVFEFLIKGLQAFNYQEHIDYEVLTEHIGDVGKVVVRVNIFRQHRQTVQYVLPTDHVKLAQAELVAIDEAAAIPLPVVKSLIGNYLVFMSSTINGYEGTGRALSLKLIQQLRANQGAAAAAAATNAGASVAGPRRHNGKEQRHLHEDRWKAAANAAAGSSSGVRMLTELSLDIPIRYAQGDPVEKWLNDLLCLDAAAASTRLLGVMPAPKDCELYMVDRDALFSYHRLSESLLQRIWALYTAAHYKNSPNDLQMLSDAPAHRLFVLLGPQKGGGGKDTLPDVLCVVQIAFEGMISQKSIQSEMAKGNKANGDMIPWTISTQYNDTKFATLSGARVVRIATHPDVQKMGYGKRAIELLDSYFSGSLTQGIDNVLPGHFGGEGLGVSADDKAKGAGEGLLDEEIAPRKTLPSLLTNIRDRPAEQLQWLGVSYGLTTQLLNFWSKKGYKICYLRQTCNDLTGEYSCMALKELSSKTASLPDQSALLHGWLDAFVTDYRSRMISLMSYSFSRLNVALSITLVDPDRLLTTASTDTNSQGGEGNLALESTGLSKGSSVRAGVGGQRLPITAEELLSVHFSHHDLKRLELYSRNMVDHHAIIDTLPTLATLFFQGRMPGIHLSFLQVAVLLATGLQRRNVDSISEELDLPANQVLAFFNKTIRKLEGYLRGLIEKHTAEQVLPSKEKQQRMQQRSAQMSSGDGKSAKQALMEDQEQDQKAFDQGAGSSSWQRKQKELLMQSKDLSQHTIDSSKEDGLREALDTGLSRQNNAIPKVLSVLKGASTPTAESEGVEASGKKSSKKKSRDSEGGKEGKGSSDGKGGGDSKKKRKA